MKMPQNNEERILDEDIEDYDIEEEEEVKLGFWDTLFWSITFIMFLGWLLKQIYEKIKMVTRK